MIFFSLPLSFVWFISCLAETHGTPFNFAGGDVTKTYHSNYLRAIKLIWDAITAMFPAHVNRLAWKQPDFFHR